MFQGRIGQFVIAVVSSGVLVNAQTAQEMAGLAKLGRGMVVYSHENEIRKITLDGSGNATVQVLRSAPGSEYRDAPMPMISHDGRYVYFRTCDANFDCDFHRMGANGGNVTKVSKASYRYVNYCRLSSGTDYSAVFCSNESLTGYATDGWWTHPKVYVMNPAGNAEKVLDFGSTLTDYLDVSVPMITYRKGRSDVYTYNLESKTETRVRQGCGQTLSPSSELLLVNNTSHNGFYLYKRAGDSWSQTSTGSFGAGRHRFKWSNLENWVSLQSEKETPSALYAFNIDSKEQIRITFDGGNGNGGLWLGDPATVARRASARPVTRADLGALGRQQYDIRGARLSASVPAGGSVRVTAARTAGAVLTIAGR